MSKKLYTICEASKNFGIPLTCAYRRIKKLGFVLQRNHMGKLLLSIDEIDLIKHSLTCLDGTNLTKLKNKKPYKNSVTVIKGVYYLYSIKRYRARIQIKGKRYILGDFKNIDDAIRARRMAEKKYFAPVIAEHMGKLNLVAETNLTLKEKLKPHSSA